MILSRDRTARAALSGGHPPSLDSGRSGFAGPGDGSGAAKEPNYGRRRFAKHAPDNTNFVQLVNRQYTKLVIAPEFKGLYDLRMTDSGELREILQDWLEKGLSKPGKKNTGLAKALGLAQPRISEMRVGRRQIDATELPSRP